MKTPADISPSPDSMDAVFQALAHETRRRILDLVKNAPGSTVGEIALDFDVSRIAVMKHLTVLEEASLLTSEKDGRTRRLYFNAAPIQMIYDRWTTEYSAYWSGKMSRLKYLAELRAQEKSNQPEKTPTGKKGKTK